MEKKRATTAVATVENTDDAVEMIALKVPPKPVVRYLPT